MLAELAPSRFWWFVLVERFLFFEVVKVLSRVLAFDLWNIRRDLVSQLLPDDTLEEGVLLDFLNTVATQSLLGVANHALEDVCGRRAEIGLGRDH